MKRLKEFLVESVNENFDFKKEYDDWYSFDRDSQDFRIIKYIEDKFGTEMVIDEDGGKIYLMHQPSLPKRKIEGIADHVNSKTNLDITLSVGKYPEDNSLALIY